ncbi:MAG: 4Fe-4S binding protein [Candidatus Omnitrophota bacterium]
MEKCTQCNICINKCRTGAIIGGNSYRKGECILCMDCVYQCPRHSTKFVFPRISFSGREKKGAGKEEKGISRGDFLFLFLSSLIFLVSRPMKVFAAEKKTAGIIRPPGALKEKDFTDRCIRCGNCIKVCPTNGLQPVMFESGIEGIWTPQLVPEIGYCEYTCNLCGKVCPTGAIRRLDLPAKTAAKLGTAVVDREICIAWKYGQECLVCQEHCPVPEKAIKIVYEKRDGITTGKPLVDNALCIGCGICQNKCPVSPERAIRVFPGRV